ncbi:unnamed protein product [Gadus morhua 'NCC']
MAGRLNPLHRLVMPMPPVLMRIRASPERRESGRLCLAPCRDRVLRHIRSPRSLLVMRLLSSRFPCLLVLGTARR